MGRIKNINNRAQFFTLDALIALTIVIVTIITIIPTLEQTQKHSQTSADILQAISSLKIKDFDNTYAKQLLSEGKISDPNKSVIDQIGEFYVTNTTIAKALAEEILSPINPNENIGIWFGTTLLASKNITPFETAQDVSIERQTISGIGGSGGATGFSSRAFLSSSARTEYVYFGGYVGEGNITTEIEYQGNITSSKIELAISDDFEIFINSISAGNFSGSPDDITPVSYLINTSFFTSGTNTFQIKGQNLHVAGGFVKITYDSEVTYQQPSRYYFPGITGIINLYDGFYIPGNLTSLTISLHFNNSVNTFLTLGKTQVFNSTSDGTTVTISNATLGGLLDYQNLSETTVPLRFGMDDMNYIINNSRDIDVFSVTDISGSMQADCSGSSPIWCCWFNDCTIEAECTACGGVLENKIQDAKDANNLFVDMILNATDNRVGLAAYSNSVLSSNYHPLSNDTASLKSEVSTWSAGGGTCICCGVNAAVNGIVANSTSDKFRSLVVMSDGDATVQCAQQGTGSANQDAIQSACDAYDDYGIKVYTIGFGAGANVPTLTGMASCADGSFYSAVDDLEDIYEKIAEELIETAYYEQTVEVTGDFFSQLYSDSYIEFEYVERPAPVGLTTTIEESFSSPGIATFTLPTNSTLVEANAISYSGPRWTSDVIINNISIYNLSAYETDFLKLGDPYSIDIPPQLTQTNNTLELKTGLSSDNLSAGSINNKIIYTISKELSSYTSVSATAIGCNWTIQFDGYNLTMDVPSDYTGVQDCKYTSPEKYCDIYADCQGATDATQVATYNLFKLLDFDLDGIIDVELSQDNMQVTTSNLEGVPFLFSTEAQIRKWQ